MWNWGRWVDLGLGLAGLLYLFKPWELRDIGSAAVSVGFLIRYVCATIELHGRH